MRYFIRVKGHAVPVAAKSGILTIDVSDQFFWLARSSSHIIEPFVKQMRTDQNNRQAFQRGGLVMNERTSEDVARRAYELFLSRDGQHGHDVDDWLEAERQLRNNGTPPRPARRSASKTRAVKTPAAARAR
jgi:hypothetical protein